MAIKISELTSQARPNASSEIAIAYGGSSYKVKISDLLSTTSTAYAGTFGFIGDSGSGATEGGQIYVGLPGISQSELSLNPEGNGWNIDCFRDIDGGYGFGAGDNTYLRFFSPMQRWTSTASGLLDPILMTPRGGLYANGFVNRMYHNITYSRRSVIGGGSGASKGDVIMQANLGLTNLDEGDAINVTYGTGNPTFISYTGGASAGMRISTVYKPDGSETSTAIRNTDIFNEGSYGTLHITKPGKTSNSTILTLTVDGVLNTIGGGASDERVKKDIESLSEAEKNVALKIKANMKKFRRTDQIEEGEKLKIGAIAQEVEQFFNEEGLDYKDYSIIHTEKRYALFEGDKIIKHELPSDIENTEVEEQKSKTKVILKDGTEYIGDVTSWFSEEECAECVSCGMTRDEYLNTKICIHIDEDKYEVIAREDIASQKILPPKGWVEVDFFRIDYDQLLAFIISAL
jgi:hypothetical protein